MCVGSAARPRSFALFSIGYSVRPIGGGGGGEGKGGGSGSRRRRKQRRDPEEDKGVEVEEYMGGAEA